MSSEPSASKGSPWWPILLAAAALAAAVDFRIYGLVQPEYEARSIVHLDPSRPILFADASETPAEREAKAQRFIDSQIAMVSFDGNLHMAMADPRVGAAPTIKGTSSPAAALRARLKVAQIPGTNLIAITFKSTVPAEAAEVANAITNSYFESRRDQGDSIDVVLTRNLQRYLREIQSEKEKKLAEQPSEADAEVDAHLKRLVCERLCPILIEASETDDAAKKAELEKKAGQLRAQLRGGAKPGKSLDWKLELEALHRKEDEVGRKLANLEFSSLSEGHRIELVQAAMAPREPAADPRWIYMVVATAAILLIFLAVGLRWDLAHTGNDPTRPTA